MAAQPPIAPMQIEGVPIYSRLPGEVSQAWEVFKAYRDMAKPRVKKTVAKEIGCSPALVTMYSNQHHWEARLLLFDQDEDALEIGARRKAQDAARDKEQQLMRSTATSMLVLAATDLGKWLAKQKAAHPNQPILSIKEISMTVDIGAKLLRVLNTDEALSQSVDRELTKQCMQIGGQEIWFE